MLYVLCFLMQNAVLERSLIIWLPLMNPYPDTRSVLVLDNSRIRHDKALAPLVRTAGCLIFLPPSILSRSQRSRRVIYYGSAISLPTKPHRVEQVKVKLVQFYSPMDWYTLFL